MIFISVEMVMNGSVSLSTSVVGIEAHSFQNAVEILSESVAKLAGEDNRNDIGTGSYRYVIKGGSIVIGEMKRDPIRMITG